MPSLFKGLKEKLRNTLKVESYSREDKERGRNRRRRRSPSRESSQSSCSSRSRDAGRVAGSRNRKREGAVTISEPHVGPTRKERAKNNEWDHVYDDPRRRHTDTPTREKSEGWKMGRLGIGIEPKGERVSSRSSRDQVPGKDDSRRSRDLHPHTSSPRFSRDSRNHLVRGDLNRPRDTVKSREDPRCSRGNYSRSLERSRNRDISPRRSTDHHHRRRRKSSHPKELSRNGPHHQSSNSRMIPPMPPMPSMPPMPPFPPTQETIAFNKKYNDRAERDRGKQIEREEVDKECHRREKEDRENQKRYADEYNERQKGKEAAANSVAKAARHQMEEETARKRRDRVAKEKEDDKTKKAEQEQGKNQERRERDMQARIAAMSPTKKDLPRLTAENLRATASADDFVDGEQTSSLNRPFGDMTRTFLEAMVPADEVGAAERRKIEKKLREKERRVN